MKKNLIVCGIDEAGRGAWAGPLVAAAVILRCSITQVAKSANTKIKDGKLLLPQNRQKIVTALNKLKAQIIVEVISSRQINNRGIAFCNREILRRLIRSVPADKYIVDGKLKLGRINGKTHKIQTLVDADATVPQVILAGIVAKVERDKIMRKLHRQFPKYNWKKNKGYGTKSHLEAISKYNVTHVHRSIFITTALNHTNKI